MSYTAFIRQRLTEVAVWIDAPDAMSNGMFPIFQINSALDIKAALRKSQTQELRGLIADDVILAWDSYEDVHGGIIDYLRDVDREQRDDPEHQPLNREWYGQVYFYPTGMALAPKRQQNYARIARNRIIKTIYPGRDIPLVEPREGTV
jgi:hypothetical protein